jgi:hypothetical protein
MLGRIAILAFATFHLSVHGLSPTPSLVLLPS